MSPFDFVILPFTADNLYGTLSSDNRLVEVLPKNEREIGGSIVITLAGVAMPDPHLDVYPITWGLTIQLVVKCQFEVNGKVTEYRFDGRMWP